MTHPSTLFKFSAIPLALMTISIPVMANDTGTTMTLGEIEVSDRAQGPLSSQKVFTSVNILGQERLEYEVPSYNWELFKKVPGVLITDFGQGTTSGKFSFRGFNGEGEINAVKLLIDGVPSNSNDGNMPYIDLAVPIDIDALEVVKGTNDPRYGLHNIAGNANILTREGGDYTQSKVTVGSFGFSQLQAGLGVESDALTQNYAFSYRQSDGHRDHSESDSFGVSGKWGLKVGSDSRVVVIARHYEADAQEAGYLTFAESRANPDQSPVHNQSDEDKREVSQLAVQSQSALSDVLSSQTQVYFNRLRDDRFVRFSAGAAQQQRIVNEDHYGASGALTWRLDDSPLGKVAVTTGLDLEFQDNRSERYITNNQVRTSQTRNQQFDFNSTGAFVQAVFEPTDRLTIIPAYRAEQLDGDYINSLNGITYSMNDYGVINQPKLSAIYELTEALSVYGNWGKSFQVGVGTASYKVGNTQDLKPSINLGYEAGLKWKPNNHVDSRIALWRQTASNEARRRLNDPANDAENIGRTQRQGLDIEVNSKPTDQVNLWASLSLQRSEILQADAASLNTQGQEIDHLPSKLYGLGADYALTSKWKLTGWISGQDNYFLERTNTKGEFGGYVLANAGVAYELNKEATVDFQVRNLTDRYHEYAWFDGSQTLHAPGAPRSFYMGLNWKM